MELRDVWWRSARHRARTSEHRVNLGKNHLRLAGFGDDVAYPAALGERASFAFMIGRRVENDRRRGHGWDGAHLAHELVAVHGGHEDVADDQLRTFAQDE